MKTTEPKNEPLPILEEKIISPLEESEKLLNQIKHSIQTNNPIKMSPITNPPLPQVAPDANKPIPQKTELNYPISAIGLLKSDFGSG